MKGKFRSFGLILVGAVAGILVSLNFQAIGQLASRSPLPVEELRAFSEVFGAIMILLQGTGTRALPRPCPAGISRSLT